MFSSGWSLIQHLTGIMDSTLNRHLRGRTELNQPGEETAKIWIHSKWSCGGFGRRLQLPNFVDLDQLVVHGILREIFHKQNHQAFTYPNWALGNSMILPSILLEAVPGHPGHPLFWIHTLDLRGKSTRGKDALQEMNKFPGGDCYWVAGGKHCRFHRRQDQISHQPELMCVNVRAPWRPPVMRRRIVSL